MSRIKLLFLAFLVVAFASGVYASFRVWNYTQHDPAFCQSCHLMQASFDKWETSAHGSVECHACHVQSMQDSLSQLIKFITLRPAAVSKHAEVDYQRCGACHLSNDPDWLQVAETAGHKVHFERTGLECVGCHSKGVHEFVRPSESCGDCHTDVVVQAKRMDELHCTACHNFLAAQDDLASPSRQRCLDCHTMISQAGLFPKNAPMQFACNQCHKPHSEGQPTSEDCQVCHQMQEYGQHSGPGHSECVSCHTPHEWIASARETCEDCHSDKTGHYEGSPCASCHPFARPGAAEPSG